MPDACTVDVKLLDAKTGEPTTYTLIPTLEAMRAVNRYDGGIAGMIAALRNSNLDAMAYCVIHGTGAKGNPVKVIEERVYATGVLAIVGDITRFVSVCANGGRDPEMTEPKPDDQVGNG